MSLDDQLNPNDGSMIDTIDDALYRFHKKIAEKWQDKTGRSKRDLETALYLGGATGFGLYAMRIKEVVMGVPALCSAIRGSFEMARPKSTKHQEIGDEVYHLPRKTTKYLSVIGYTIGTASTLGGVGKLVIGLITGDDKMYAESINELAFGLGALNLVSADYISKSNIGEPPKKKKKPISERIKEKLSQLLPRPLPQPQVANQTGDFKNEILDK
jgi:hypothetical protein